MGDTMANDDSPCPGAYPNGKQGQVLTVEFTVVGVACLDYPAGNTATACVAPRFLNPRPAAHYIFQH